MNTDRFVRVFAVLLLIASEIIWFAFVFHNPASRLTDYRIYDVFATAAAEGLDPYAVSRTHIDSIASDRWGLTSQNLAVLSDLNNPDTLSMPYPPFFYILIRPLTTLAPLAGAMLWFVGSCVALGITALLLSRWREGKWVDPIIFIVIAVFAPVLQTLSGGQINSFVLLAIVVGLVGYEIKKPGIAGLGFAVAIVLKPLPAILAIMVYLLWRRAVRDLVWVLIWLVAMVTATLPLASIRSWAEYVLGIVSFGKQVSFSSYSEGVSLWTFLVRLMPVESARVVGLILSISVIMFTAFVLWRSRGRDWGAGISLVIVGSLFVSSISWLHYQVLLLIPLTFILRGCSLSLRNWRVTPTHWFAFLSIFLLNLHALTYSRFESQPWLSSWGTFALAILFGVLLWRSMPPRRIAAIANPIQERQPIP